MLDQLSGRGVRWTSTAASCPSASPSSSPARDRPPRDRPRRHAPGASTTTSTCSRWRAATASSWSAAAPAWPGVASPPESRWREADAAPARHRVRRRGRRARHRARGASARSPTVPAPTTELVVPEVVWGRADDGTRWVTTITAAGCADVPDVAVAATDPLPQPSSVTVQPVRPAGVVVRAGGAGHQGDARRARGRAQQGRAGAGGARRGRRAVRPGRRARAPAARLPRLLPVPRRRLPRRQPRAAGEPHR